MFAALIGPIVNLVVSVLQKHPQANDTSTPIPSWISGLLAFLQSLGTLQPFNSTQNDISNLGAILASIASNGSGFLPAEVLSVVTAAQGVLTKFSAVAKDYLTDQFALLDDNFSFDGKPGVVLALAKDGFATPIPAGVTTIGGLLGENES
jgi:hypothetical protein